MADHNIRVVSLLTGEEYLALKHMAGEDGLSDSAFIRRLLRLEAHKRAVQSVSDVERVGESAEAAQLLNRAMPAA